jgi:hypothetical protein
VQLGICCRGRSQGLDIDVVGVLMSDEYGMRAPKGVGDLARIQEDAWVDDERPTVVIQPNA